MNQKTYKKDDVIALNVYGDVIKGKFISETENVITVEIISDSSGDSTPGDHETFHKGHITIE
jgi:hypothetical protein